MRLGDLSRYLYRCDIYAEDAPAADDAGVAEVRFT
jgi:hypothetical protein